MNRRRAKRRPPRNASAIVEMAVLLPLLLTIALLCIDFGRFAHTFIAINNAARAGAGYASMHPHTATSRSTWVANTQQAIIDEMAAGGWFDAENLQIPAPQLIDDGGGRSRVSVQVTYSFETLIRWPFLPGYNDPIRLTRTVVMRLIR
jgi:hypothetical protein